MSEKALQGKDIIWKYRLVEDEKTSEAFSIAYTTSNSYSKSMDSDTITTKDGSIVMPGTLETTASVESYYKVSDATIAKIEEAFDKGKKFQVWRINTKEAGTGANKFKAKYFEGYVTSFEAEDTAEDLVTISLEFSLEGGGVNGEATLTVDASGDAGYKFKDTTKNSED